MDSVETTKREQEQTQFTNSESQNPMEVFSANKTFMPPKKKEAKEKKPKEIEIIEDSKMALMMFKTAIRNHIDLSSLADNKANTMLSVNALIITVALPLMISYVESNKLLVLPMICLLITCIASMYYATDATRPIKLHGKTSDKSIENGESDLFFFGNFCNMEYDEYEEGIEKVIKRNDWMQKSITKDLFFSGKALGDKFDNLRLSYTIFIRGMLTSSVLFAISVGIHLFYGNIFS